ncbi:glycosyltransferase family 87 protein [Roseomonas rosulenta]|uniref:glycosyltransferase family 87 protein n=1 Tax=Roseomonas rosulenta TaxID=2748667 RepID=UPI0018E01408|nr:glycosyltransferase family 87 protein [Roseomonas rosulenta]
MTAWLTRDRLVLLAWLFCVSVFGFYMAVVVTGTLVPERAGRADFIAFHNASQMALLGDAAGAYDWSRLRLLQAETLGIPPEALEGFLGWVNPPHFFFYVLPFGLLSYGAGWFAWVVATVLVLILALRVAFPDMAGPASMLALAMPAVLICIGLGQNGVLTAALLCLTFALMDRRPVLAGLALGLLTYKPQFGLLLPLLLVATGRWRVFVSAAATAVTLMAGSAFAFGLDAWSGFLGALSRNDAMYLGERHAALPRIQSVYALVFDATDDRMLAWMVHVPFAAGIAVLVLWLWLRRPEGLLEARSAAAMAAAFLMTPFTWIYDAVALGGAALFLVAAARREGWLAGERAMLLVACLLPGIVLLGVRSPMVAPAAWLLILACAWRRDRAWRLSRAPSDSPSAGT